MDHRQRRFPPASPSSNQPHVFHAVADPAVEQRYRPLVSVQTRAGTLSLRDAMASDVEAYVAYWHYSGESIKDLLGIDRLKLGAPDDSRERFLRMIRAPGTFPRDVIFTATLNDKIVGYTNMNRYGGNDNYVHLHIYRTHVRSVCGTRPVRSGLASSAGLAAALIGPGLSMYFRLFPVRRLILQTRPQNRAINKALDLYQFPVERMYVENPAGLAAAGEQCLRYVHREDVTWMLRRGEVISSADRTSALRRPNDAPLDDGWNEHEGEAIQ